MTGRKDALVSIPLGHPLPLDEHACSVSLPTWCSVVGYEEGNPDVTSKMGCGYPRFVYHPYLLKLMDLSLTIDAKKKKVVVSEFGGKEEKRDCILLPGKGCANRARDFMIKALNMEGTIPLSSPDNALDSFGSIEDEESYPIRVLKLPTDSVDIYALIFPAMTNAAIQAKSYWQHCGEVVSSRRAEVALMELGVELDEIERVTPNCIDPHTNTVELEGVRICPSTNRTYTCLHTSTTTTTTNTPSTTSSSNSSNNAKKNVKERIASIVSQPSSSVFLAPSGMAAIYQALRSARRRRLNDFPSKNNHSDVLSNFTSSNDGGGTAIVYGFPYLDTLKMCGRAELVPNGVEFFGCGDSQDLIKLEEMLEARASNHPEGDAGICALITEFPSNPLLNCHDLLSLRYLADKYNFALIVDDTISCFANVDLLNTGIADVICTSLTKLFNGRGDAMAGSLVVNEKTKIGQWMRDDLKNSYELIGEENALFPSDIEAIDINSVDFLERSHTINRNSEQLADWLSTHPDVQTTYYPKFSQPELYNRFLTDPTPIHTPGYGGLLAILLESHICQRTFYDQLPLSKGPSLGTNFTLICPYTLLAHYHELEFARTYNVSPNLIRIAVGLEDFEVVKGAFEYAFTQGRLHPKLKPLENDGGGSSDGAISNNLNQAARGYSTISCGSFLGNHKCGRSLMHSNHMRHVSHLSRAVTKCRGGGVFGRLISNGLLQSRCFGAFR